MRLSDSQRAAFHLRLILSALIVAAAAAGLSVRWAHLQVGRFEHFSERSQENLITVLPAPPARGLIVDRNGVILADNVPRYSLSVVSDSAAAVLEKLPILRTAVRVPPTAVKRLKRAAKSDIYEGEIVIRDFLDEKEVAAFIGAQYQFPEIVLEARLARHYPFRDSAAHVIGHVGRIAESDKEKIKAQGLTRRYRGSRYIGKTGVESIHERTLHGQPGLIEAQVDAHGRVMSSVRREAPSRGGDVYLTMDIELQRFAESLLADRRGAIVALDAENGEILALASSPRFDINNFVAGLDSDSWRALNESAGKPLVHRAIYGQYAPGSTIKPFIALAALERGWRDLDYTYKSIGHFALTPKHIFHDWKAGGHGQVDIKKSIVRSVNSFYYQLAHDVGVDELSGGLAPFGFGSITGIDLDGEKTGVLPSTYWKEEAIGEQWFPGDTIAVGVGQGYMQVTPLQLARAMAMIANGGKEIRPHLLRREESADDISPRPESSASQFFSDSAESPPPPPSPANAYFPAEAPGRFNGENLRIVREALAAVTLPGGTAPRVGRESLYAIAGKTGTAQVSRLQLDDSGKRIKNEDLPEHLRDHAWFVGYAPADRPLIAVAAIVEHGGSGGRIAGPLVRRVMDKYLIDIAGLSFADEETAAIESETILELESQGESELELEDAN